MELENGAWWCSRLRQIPKYANLICAGDECEGGEDELLSTRSPTRIGILQTASR